MEPLDDETKRWLAESAKASEAKRAEYFRNANAATEARKLAEARRLLGRIPPPLPGWEENFVLIYQASEEFPDVSAKIVEGVVFDIYGVMCGKMDGRDDFTGFDLITPMEEISSWRYHYPSIVRGNRLRIKFIDEGNLGFVDDHMDDVVLEVWVDQSGMTSDRREVME